MLRLVSAHTLIASKVWLSHCQGPGWVGSMTLSSRLIVAPHRGTGARPVLSAACEVEYYQHNALRHNLSNLLHCVIMCLAVGRVRCLAFRSLREWCRSSPVDGAGSGACCPQGHRGVLQCQ